MPAARQAKAVSCPTKQGQYQKNLLVHGEQFYRLKGTKKLKRASLPHFILQATPVVGKIVMLPSLQQHPSHILPHRQPKNSHDSYSAPENKVFSHPSPQFSPKACAFPPDTQTHLCSTCLSQFTMTQIVVFIYSYPENTRWNPRHHQELEME